MSSVWSAFILLSCANLLFAKLDFLRDKRSVHASPVSSNDKDADLSLEVRVFKSEEHMKSSLKDDKSKDKSNKVTYVDPSWSEKTLKRSTRDLTSNDQNLRTVPPRSGECGTAPCQNGGSCISLESGGRRRGYRCLCAFGYEGVNCETNLRIRYPKFEAVGSYIVLKPGISTANNFSITLELKVLTTTGLLLYTNPTPRRQPSAFFSLTLVSKQLEFRFGIQDTIAIMKTENKLEQGRWYKIKLERQGRRGTIFVDDKLWRTSTESKQMTPVVSENTRNRLYLGGFPNHMKRAIQEMLVQHAGNGAEVGMIGCVKKLVINNKDMDLRQEEYTGDVLQGAGIKECSDKRICAQVKCQNGGTCQLKGPDEYRCLCPRNFKGEYCEKAFKLKLPKFTGHSHLKYTVLKRTSRSETKLEIVFRPTTDTGLLLYSGYSADKRGDFLAIFLKNGICQAYFDLGSGAAKIKSKFKLSLNQWHRAYFKRLGRLGSLKVDNQPLVEAFTPGGNVQLTLRQDFFLGNHENFDVVSYYMPMRQGFKGCVQKLAVGGKLIRLIEDAKQAVNVDNCAHKCSQRVNPCSDKGECLPMMNYYNCSCALGYMGTHCEIKMERDDITYPEFTGQSYLLYRNEDFMRKISKPKMSFSLTYKANQERNQGVLFFLGSNMDPYSRYLLIKLRNNNIEIFVNDGSIGFLQKMTNIGKITKGQEHRITIKRTSGYNDKNDKYILLLGDQEVTSINQPRDPKLAVYSQLLIGGVDKHTAVRLSLSGNSGVRGCIKDIELATDEGSEVLLVSHADDGRSVRQCKSGGNRYT